MIIINSDDFGASPSINNATFVAFSRGLISSTSTLVNFDEGLMDAVSYVESGKIDPDAIGIHLNLTQGIPLTKKIRKISMFCENEVFKYNRRSSSIFKLDDNSRECVNQELEAQMNRFIEKFGFLPSHIDSHQHIHTEWAIAQCVMKLAKKYNIKCLRLARNTGETTDFKKNLYRTTLNKYIKFKGFKITDKFGSIENLIYSGIKSAKNYEIMVHAMMSPDGKNIVDLDNQNLNQRLIELFHCNKWNIVNYTEFRQNSI